MMKTKDLVYLPFKLMGHAGKFLFHTKVLRKEEGAQFAKDGDYKQYINNSNKGLVLDGVDASLSETESFQNVCVMARIGAGKTTKYVIPNLLKRAKTNSSIVVNDPKGEVFENTSQYMKSQGFRVIVVDPENLSRSACFNPLSDAKDNIELEQVAEILVRCGTPDSKDPFWGMGASRFISVFLRCLKNAQLENPEYNSLHNLYYLFQNFGKDGSKLNRWISTYSINPDDPSDESLWNDWKGVLTGNEEGIQSFVLNAITSLRALSNSNIAKLTSKSDLELESIRKQKTVIYFITPPQRAEYYAFLTSIFFRSVFNVCMRELPKRDTLPVYVLYDEFGHSTIPNFVSTANTIRGYKVSLSIILQSIAQLNDKYGQETAYSIQGGFNTYLAYSGSDPATAQFFETIIGKTRITQFEQRETAMFSEHYREQNLINANEVRTMDNEQVLIVSSNKAAIMTKVTPYFKTSKYRRWSGEGAAKIKNAEQVRLTYLDLKNADRS